MINWIIGGLLFLAMFFAVRYVFRKHKKGRCAGGCAGCTHCCQFQQFQDPSEGVEKKK